MPVDKSRIHNILVISLSNIGDIILTTPIISLLREHFPTSQVTVAVGPKGVSILEGSKTVDRVIIFDKKATLSKQISFVSNLRRGKFDLVVDLRNTAIPLFLRPRYRTSFFVDRRAESMRQRHLDQLRSLIPVSNAENHFEFFNEEEKKSALRKLKQNAKVLNGNDFVIVAPGAGSELKRWTLSGFSEVIEYFNQKGMTVVLLGGQNEQILGEELGRKSSRPIGNLIGLLTFRESAALVSQASMVIANDSAVMHLAHELNRPVVSIFGPTNDKKYGQTGANRRMVRLYLDCAPCEKAQCQIERRRCLDDLPASLVIDACEELLSHDSITSAERMRHDEL